MTTNNPTVQVLKSTSADASTAVSEIKSQINIKKIEIILFFCSSHYDLDLLSSELNSSFDCLVVGCTTAGEISDSYQKNSIVALVLSSKSYAVHPSLIKNVQNFNLSNAMKIATNIESKLRFNEHFSTKNIFGFLLTDGMSLKEERITSILFKAMGDINIIGGSAADDLDFKQTYIFFNNVFQNNSSVLMVIEVKDDFEVFRMQHFEPTDKEVITTEVDFEKRIVKEIDGQPAADAYAEINGLNPLELDSLDFAMFPLMLNVSDEWYIRSISGVLPDKSLQFHCSIDAGLPLCIASGNDIVQKLDDEIKRIEEKFKRIDFTLGCDCILRRLEIDKKGYTQEIEKLLSKINFIGFNSYGEQFNGLHFNQTLVGVVVKKSAMDDFTKTELKDQIVDLRTQLQRQKKTTNALLARVKKNLKYQLNSNETFEHNSYLLNQIKRTKSQLFHETKTSERFSYIAKHDSLTGLYNRVEFNKVLKRIVKSAKNQKRKHALMFLDLDQFKVINDTAGHLAGDEMIKQISTLLLKTVEAGETLARLGGDEIGFLIENCSQHHALLKAETLLSLIDDFHFPWDDKLFTVSASIGIVVINKTTISHIEAQKNVDIACYAAKNAGRNRVHLYQEQDDKLLKQNAEMQWIPKLTNALDNDLFCLYAQPIKPTNSKAKHIHYEILVRLIDNNKIILPGVFLPPAERYNLITKIDTWIISHTFQWLSEHIHSFHPYSHFSINLSG